MTPAADLAERRSEDRLAAAGAYDTCDLGDPNELQRRIDAQHARDEAAAEHFWNQL